MYTVEPSLIGTFIWPSATAVNAPGWYITPDIVFGKLESFTLFNITAPTATCPSYGSPLASPFIALANNCMSDVLLELWACTLLSLYEVNIKAINNIIHVWNV